MKDVFSVSSMMIMRIVAVAEDRRRFKNSEYSGSKAGKEMDCFPPTSLLLQLSFYSSYQSHKQTSKHFMYLRAILFTFQISVDFY